MATIQGYKRSATKLGTFELLKPSTMTDAEEFWPFVKDMADVPSWPSVRYPLALYTSSDHSVSTGGIFLRVYDSNLGSMEDSANWLEWDSVSGRAEFSHITKKTNPIYVDNVNGNQTETPWVTVVGGVVYLHYHNNGLSNGYATTVQQTVYATGSNGVDFARQDICVTYDPAKYEGDGHTGYLRFGTHSYPHVPKTYIGKATHGGGAPSRGGGLQIVVSDDMVNWETLHFYARQKGILSQFNPSDGGVTDWIWNIEDVQNPIKEGAYWRILGMVRPQILAGGEDNYARPVEYLVDEDFNMVAEPNIVVPLGGAGAIDEFAVNNLFEFEYDGKKYGMYKAWDNTTSRIALVEIQDIRATWDILRGYSSKVESQRFEAQVGDTLPAGVTITKPAGVRPVSKAIFTPMETDGSDVYVYSDTPIQLSSSEITDIRFEDIGKDVPRGRQFIIFGLVNQDAFSSGGFNATELLISRFHMPNDPADANPSLRSEPLEIRKQWVGQSLEIVYSQSKYVGVVDNWVANSKDESGRAKLDLGLRFIPSENKMILLAGASELDYVDITGFDYTKSMRPFIRAFMSESNTESRLEFKSLTVKTSSLSNVTQPDTPILTATPQDSAIDVSCSTVVGAAGYKAFYGQNGVYQEQDLGAATSGTISGLTNDEAYDVYVRSYDANGVESEPAAEQQVTPSVVTSALNISVSGIPDGTYKTYLIDQSDNIIYNANVAYAGGSVTLLGLAVPAGTELEGYVIDNETPHANGAVITGVTV